MVPFEKCPVCGGDLIEKEVEKVLRGGVNTAVLKVCAEVCLRCDNGSARRIPCAGSRRFGTWAGAAEASELRPGGTAV